MIEIKITGETHNEAAAQLLGLANRLALGLQLEEAQRNLATGVPQGQPMQDNEPPIGAAKAVKIDKVKKTKDVEPKETETVDVEELIAEEVLKDRPIPKNTDELRALLLRVMKEVSNDTAGDIIKKYAAKVSDVPADKYAAMAKDCYDAITASAEVRS